MRYFILSLICFAIAVPCQAQGFKNMAQQFLSGQQQQPAQMQVVGSPSGSSSFPAGNYMMVNMNSGQAFYVTVVPGGQMFAADPRSVFVSIQTPGQGQLLPGQTLPQQQPQAGGIGGTIKGVLGNYLDNKINPQPAPAPTGY